MRYFHFIYPILDYISSLFKNISLILESLNVKAIILSMRKKFQYLHKRLSQSAIFHVLTFYRVPSSFNFLFDFDSNEYTLSYRYFKIGLAPHSASILHMKCEYFKNSCPFCESIGISNYYKQQKLKNRGKLKNINGLQLFQLF